MFFVRVRSYVKKNYLNWNISDDQKRIFVIRNTGCSVEIVLFPRIFIILPPLPRQHWATIGCTNIGQHPIGVTVHSHCVESLEGLSQRCRRGKGFQWIVKKNIFFWPPCSKIKIKDLAILKTPGSLVSTSVDRPVNHSFWANL